MYHVYNLHSEVTHRYYTGSTEDVTNRFAEHNRGESRSTRSGIPWSLVRVEDYATRAEAMAQERRIKARGAARYLASLNDHQPS